jgi:hypothetical protein
MPSRPGHGRSRVRRGGFHRSLYNVRRRAVQAGTRASAMRRLRLAFTWSRCRCPRSRKYDLKHSRHQCCLPRLGCRLKNSIGSDFRQRPHCCTRPESTLSRRRRVGSGVSWTGTSRTQRLTLDFATPSSAVMARTDHPIARSSRALRRSFSLRRTNTCSQARRTPPVVEGGETYDQPYSVWCAGRPSSAALTTFCAG